MKAGSSNKQVTISYFPADSWMFHLKTMEPVNGNESERSNKLLILSLFVDFSFKDDVTVIFLLGVSFLKPEFQSLNLAY